MAPSLTTTGIQIDSLSVAVSDTVSFYQSVYGTGINVGPSSPDGQVINNYCQSSIDTQEWTLQCFTSFDPDQAFGVILDQRCAINGVQREMGTYSETNVAITVNSTITLFGQDQTENPVYTVTDIAGSMDWNLITTVTLTAGTYQLGFDAASLGAVMSVPGTISVPVTVVLGVTNINNNQTQLSIGTPQETDAQFKIRRQQSTAIGSQGYYAGLIAQLENISGVGVGNVKVYENETGATSTGTVPPYTPAGIPSHSIWVVVAGGTASESVIGGVAGANALAIATAIYNKRNAGCGMLGAQAYAITRPDGTVFAVFWDIVDVVNPFVEFTVGSINGSTYPNLAAIYSQLPSLMQLGINQLLTVNQLISLVNSIDSNTYVSGAGFSTTVGGSYTPTLSPAAANDQFQILEANLIVTPMIIYSSTSTISITQGIALTFTVTDQAVHGYTFSISSASASSGATYTDTNGNVFTVAATVSSSTIINMSLTTPASNPPPAAGTLTKTGGTGAATLAYTSYIAPTTLDFTGYGGYQGGGLTYSIPTNNSGATISSDGVYIAGPTPGIDTVKVEDTLSNVATVVVTVS